jgi:hypothetical protein
MYENQLFERRMSETKFENVSVRPVVKDIFFYLLP